MYTVLLLLYIYYEGNVSFNSLSHCLSKTDLFKLIRTRRDNSKLRSLEGSTHKARLQFSSSTPYAILQHCEHFEPSVCRRLV